MNFFYVKIFSLLFVLRICEVFHTSEINILKYKHGKEMCAEKFVFVRSLSEELKEKKLNTQITGCDLLYDKLEKYKSRKYSNLRNYKEINYYNKRKKQKESKLQGKITRQGIKDKLYKMIFKGKNFWKILSYTIRTLGVASAVSLYLGILFAFIEVSIGVAFIGAWSVFLFLLIIIILGTWFLATWIWPHRDTYNEKYRV